MKSQLSGLAESDKLFPLIGYLCQSYSLNPIDLLPDSKVSSGGRYSRTFNFNMSHLTGSQEVIGSIPICSTKIIKGLQILRFAIPFFLPVFCQKDCRKRGKFMPGNTTDPRNLLSFIFFYNFVILATEPMFRR